MNTYRIPIILFLFCTFTLSGFLAGRTVIHVAGNYVDDDTLKETASSYNASNERKSFPIPNLAESLEKQSNITQDTSNPPLPSASAEKIIQENILMVLVDDLLNEKPSIQGIWLILYFTDTAHLTFMPIYPDLSNHKQYPNVVKELEGALQTQNNSDLIDQILESNLHQQVWWNGYIITDDYALNGWLEIINNQSIKKSNNLLDFNLSAVIPSPQNNPKKALKAEVNILQDFCATASGLTEQPDYSQLVKLVNEHIYTDLDFVYFLSGWATRLNDYGPLSCEFPFHSIE